MRFEFNGKKISKNKASWILLSFSTLVLISFVYLAITALLYVSTAQDAEGVVIELREVITSSQKKSSKSSISYKAVINFIDNNGIKHTASTAASYPAPAQLNERLNILYNPQNPQEICINSFVHLYGLPLGFLIIGIGMLIAGLVLHKQVSNPKKTKTVLNTLNK